VLHTKSRTKKAADDLILNRSWIINTLNTRHTTFLILNVSKNKKSIPEGIP